MCAQFETGDDKRERREFELPDSVTAKNVILNAYLLSRPGVTKKALHKAINEAIDVSYEFVRRTISEVETQEISKEDVSAVASEQIQDALRPIMRESGLLTPQQQSEDADVVTWPANVGHEGGSIPVSEVERVVRDIELLERQVEFEEGENKKAQFISKTVLEELEELVETYSPRSSEDS